MDKNWKFPQFWCLLAQCLFVGSTLFIVFEPVSKVYQEAKAWRMLSSDLSNVLADSPFRGALSCSMGSIIGLSWHYNLLSPKVLKEIDSPVSYSVTLSRLGGQLDCLVGKDDEAIQYFQLAKDQSSSDPLSSLNLAIIYAKNGDRSGAEREISSSHLTASAVNLVANIYYDADELGEALYWCKQALRINSEEQNSWDLWRKIGIKYEGKKDWEAAFEVYQAALEASEDHPESNIYRGSFYLRSGLVLLQMKDPDKNQQVINFYNAAILDGHFVGDGEKASAYRSRGDWYRFYRPKYSPETYLADYQTAFRIKPQSSGIAITIGLVYFQDIKDISRAEESFRFAISLAPQDSSGYFYLGKVLAAKGDWVGTVEAFEKAMELKPDWKEVQDLLKAARSNL